MTKNKKIYAKEDDVYFRKQSDAPDGAEKMKAGEELIIIDGPWWRVTRKGVQGWVRGDYLTEAAPVQSSPNPDLPNFVRGRAHPANHPVTKRVREIINDEFGLGKIGYFLNCTEYVQYCVQIKLNHVIQWPSDRPRDGGKWAPIFERNGKYKVLDEPKANCAISFADVRRRDGTLTEEGHVAFVEEVYPDATIKISEANWPRDGIYSERTLTRAEWKDKYKGRFIEFA